MRTREEVSKAERNPWNCGCETDRWALADTAGEDDTQAGVSEKIRELGMKMPVGVGLKSRELVKVCMRTS